MDTLSTSRAATNRRAKCKLLAAARLFKRSARVGVRKRAVGRLPTAVFVTDPERVADPVATARRLPPGWMVVYRHFGATDRTIEARKLAEVCRRRRLILLISADPRLAMQVGADGVHWPEARLTSARRRPRPGNWIETASAHSAIALRRAEARGCDAALLSPLFASKSRSAVGKRGLGVLAMRALLKRTQFPVYALGGIDAGAAHSLARRRLPLAGFAAVGAIADAF